MKTSLQNGSSGRVSGARGDRLPARARLLWPAAAALAAAGALAGLCLARPLADTVCLDAAKRLLARGGGSPCARRADAPAQAAAMRQAPATGALAPGAAQPVPPPAPNEWLFVGDAFEGTFLQLWQEHTAWTREQWAAEFAQLRRAGMKTLVVQWTRYDELDFTAPGPDRTSPLERVVAAADAAGIDLCVGLALRKSWWTAECFQAPYLQEELARNRQLATRLFPLLRGHRSFYGWYLPHEITDIGTEDGCGSGVRAFFSALTAHLNELDALKPIVASGYTDRDRAKLVHFVAWWTLFLREAGIDILVFQDGAGLARENPWTAVAPWIDALGTVAGEVGPELWLVGEVFRQTHGKPIDEGAFQAEPADFARVGQQLELLGAFKRRLLAYSYFDHMRPSAGRAAATLFDAYVRFADARATARRDMAADSPVPATAGSAP